MEGEARFRAMGSDVHVIVVGGRVTLLEAARELIEELELRWSRFKPSSEISRLNAHRAEPVRVSPPTLALVQRALEGAHITGGRYDPTVLDAVLQAGYDRSFELLANPATATATGAGPAPGPDGGGRLPGAPPRHRHRAPSAGRSWRVAIEHPLWRTPVATVGLRSGAVATSSRTRRAWGPPHDRRHHLIDPATGLPARSGVATASVVAAEAWQAEVLAKALFIGGLGDGFALLDQTGTEGLLIDDHGAMHPSAEFGRFIGATGRRPSVAAGVAEPPFEFEFEEALR